MIKTRQDLRYYLEEDLKNYPPYNYNPNPNLLQRLHCYLLSNPISDTRNIILYIKTLRKVEYYLNTPNIIHKLLKVSELYKLRRLSYKTGFQIPPNVCGPGLTIYHWGPIIINSNVCIGHNCVLYPGVLIGWKGPKNPACAVIGDHVFIGSGTKIIGGVHIGNHVTIAPNSIVVKDIEDNTVVGGTLCHIP
ncbi:MAG: serine acetyltransferase [Prevotella sp.]|jgi:serine O-acetyltransferase|nr:serine acetyltransferase [Prevotella sp.]MCH4017755.1 serine acetyltransferase [Prevotella sp.]